MGLSGAFLTGFVRTALKGFGPVQGIRGAFWALGALTLPVCLVGSALLTDPPPAKQKPEEQGRGKGTPSLDLAPLQMLRTKQYWLCAGAVCFSTPAVLLFSPIILKLGVERGLDLPGVKILMKAGSKMGRVKELLLERDMEVSMVENCGMDDERIFMSLEEIPDEPGYYSLLIVR